MAKDDDTQFHPADYCVFAASLALSAGVGVYYGLCGDRKKPGDDDKEPEPDKGMSPIPVSFSVLASFLAAPFVLGTPAEMYTHGTMYSLVVFGFGLAVPFVSHMIIPVFHKLDISSGYQYLELRFSNKIRLMGSAIFALMMLLYMAVVVFAPALAFAQVTGLSMYVSILGVGIICTFYTTVGGLKAVMWIDVIQMMIILAGLMILTIKGTIDAGGLEKVWEKAQDGGRLIFDEVSPDPRTRHSWWTQTIGGCFITLVLIGINQAIVQKYLSIPKVRDAQKTPYLAWLLLFVYMIFVCFVGLVMYAYYYDCDPFTDERVESVDQLIPLFMMDVLGDYYGIPGLITATVFAATLSTVAAGIAALAAITFLDAVHPLYIRSKGQPMSPRAAMLTNKALCVVYGCLTIAMAFIAPFFGEALLQIAISIFGVAGGPLLGLFIMGFFFPFANAYGAAFGTIAGISFTFWLSIGAIITKPTTKMLKLLTDECDGNRGSSEEEDWVYNGTTYGYHTDSTDHMWTTMGSSSSEEDDKDKDEGGLIEFYSVSYMWYTLIAVSMTLLVGLIVSCITGGNKKNPVEQRLLFQFSDCCPPNADDDEAEPVIVKNGVNAAEKGVADVNDIHFYDPKGVGVVNATFTDDGQNTKM